ncbi:MAG: T9SS type A sorting domain-containing protein, partial [Bacteroidales bacterium]|nr:T9SS type A sorting domain-containing protein [Bacteroidales bacterium]
SAVIHGNSDFKDPNDANTSSLYKGKAILDFPSTDWVQKKIPFIYDGTNTDNVSYLLVTLTTNARPGGGNSGDALYVDDMELIYSAWLKDIKMDGQTIAGFEQGILSCDIVYPRGTDPVITYIPEVSDVTIKDTLINGTVNVNDTLDGAQRIVVVTAEDSLTTKTYTLTYHVGPARNATLDRFVSTLDNVTFDTITVPLQIPDDSVQHIYTPLLPPGTTQASVISATDVMLADTGARVLSVTNVTSVKDSATITVKAENGRIKTYYIHFPVALSGNDSLASILYNSFSVSPFHPDTLSYHVVLPPLTANPPLVSATAAWAGLTPHIVQAYRLKDTAKITVTAENNINQRTYLVSFSVLPDTNVNLSSLTYNYSGGGHDKKITDLNHDTVTIELPFGTMYLTKLSAVSASPTASSIGYDLTLPIQLPVIAHVTVTAENTNYTKTHIINFVQGRNDNAHLDSLYYILGNDTTLVLNFNKTKEHYLVALPVGTVATPTLYCLLADTHAHAIVTDPSSPRDTGKVVVTAENGSTTKTYTVVFSVTLSTDVSLSEIKIVDTVLLSNTGIDSTIALPNALSYNIPLDTTIVPKITVTTTYPTATWSIIYPDTVPGQVKIIVTAEDTTVKETYRINFLYSEPTNPNLVDLGYTLGGITYYVPNFHPDTLEYHVLLPSQTTQTPAIVCQAADPNVLPDITAPIDPNSIGTVNIQSTDQSKNKTYQISFTVEISTNAKLDSLFYDGIAIEDFNPSVFSYRIELPYTTTAAVTVSPKTQSPAATIDSIRQAVTITDSAFVDITAEDASTKCRYVIHFTRQLSPVATLSEIKYTLSGADSTIEDFQSDEVSYTVFLAPETVSIPQLLFTLADTNAQAQLIRTPLHPNDTAIIRVTAENQIEHQVYVIVFSRIKSANNRLSDLQYNGISLSNFNSDTLNYMVILPWEETQIPVVTATSQWDSMTVNIPPITTVFGTVNIQVIPEDGGQARYYEIAFERGSNVELQALRWSLDGNTYSSVENFDANDTGYHVLLPIGTTVRPVMEWDLEDSRSLVDVANDFSLPNGITTVTITGWDSLNVKIYTVEFEVELSTEAALSDLMVNGVTIANFHTDTLNYFIECEYGSAFPLVTATATQPDARIDYTQINEYPAVAVIKVFAGDTTVQREYTIAFSIEAGDNAFLSDLLIDSVSLADFDKNVFFYDVILPYGTTTLPVVSATAEDERATVTITQIAQLGDTAKIQVTAINGDIKEYQLYFMVDGNSNAYASNIFVDGKIVENFNATSRNYNYILPADYTGIPVVTAELADPKASYTVKNATQIPGQTVIETTAENQRDKFSYRINFTKETSVVSFENHTTLSIFPNPGSSVINFDLKGISQTANLEISTVDGRILGKYTLQEGINPVEIEHLQKGVYFYKVYTEKKILGTGKFIKQ